MTKTTSCTSSTMNGTTVGCVYCYDEFDNPKDQLVHVISSHGFGQCNKNKKFYYVNDFRRHLELNHTVTKASQREVLVRIFRWDERQSPQSSPLMLGETSMDDFLSMQTAAKRFPSTEQTRRACEFLLGSWEIKRLTTTQFGRKIQS